MLKFAKTLPVGLQLYSVRDFAEKDLASTLKKVKEIGYDYVELAGFYGVSPTEFRKLLDENSLVAISAHVPYADLVADLDGTLGKYLTVGVKFIAVPYLGNDDRPKAKNFETVLENIKKFGEKCNEKGLTLLYHNHDFEFVSMDDGSYGLDYMYNSIPADLLQTELDCCWVKVAGEDPASYVRKYASRCPVVHLKDFTGAKTDNMYNLIGLKEEAKTTAKFAFRPVGYGKQDIPDIITAAIESGASFLIVEQDNPGEQSSLEAVTMSRNYLKTLGF